MVNSQYRLWLSGTKYEDLCFLLIGRLVLYKYKTNIRVNVYHIFGTRTASERNMSMLVYQNS